MIERFNLNDVMAAPYGLVPFRSPMEGLRRVVILAGPNGGGKSRVLKALKQCLDLCGQTVNLDAHRNTARVHEGQVAQLRAQSVTQPGLGGHLERQISAYEQGIAQLAQTIARIEAANQTLTMRGGSTDTIHLDTSAIPAGQAGGQELFKVGPSAGSRAAWLNRHAKALFNSGHPMLAEDPVVQANGGVAKAVSNELQRWLRTELKFDVDAQQNPVPNLFDRTYVPAELSAGQLLLLTWLVLFSEEGQLPDQGQIVLVDEPERHLHPKAAIEVLDRLLGAVGAEGQVWIATHCPAIVAHFGDESIYYVANNTVEFARTRINLVMDGLLGDEEARRKLADFFADAEKLNLQRFAAESLFGAGVASHEAGDRQEHQFAELVAERLANQGGRLRIADYGAGAGRFAAALAEVLPNDVRERIEYFAYNSPAHDKHRAECAANIARLHGPRSQDRIKTTTSDLWGENQVDVVVMSNFLHEIAPAEWASHLRKAGEMLVDGGLLLVMEDQEPPVGELPTRNGFFVMDLEELRRLFGRTPQVQALVQDPRLTAFSVPKALLISGAPLAVREALDTMKDRAKTKLRELRSDASATPQTRGRRHAFYALLFASAALALDEMG